MNKYPYPVLCPLDSSYVDDCKFSITYKAYELKDNELKLTFDYELICETLSNLINSGLAKLVIKSESGLLVKAKNILSGTSSFSVSIPVEKLSRLDNIKVSALLLADDSFELNKSQEMIAAYDDAYQISIRKNDVLGISNVETIEYKTTADDFIKFTVSKDITEGYVISLSSPNYIQILISQEFNSAYFRLRQDKHMASILGSNIVFETVVYALIEIVQNKEDYEENDWYSIFANLFNVSIGTSLDDFVSLMNEDIDIAKIYAVAHTIVNNQIVNSVVSAANVIQ